MTKKDNELKENLGSAVIGHTGYIGNMKKPNLSAVMDKNPSFVIMNAVKGMLPKNPLGRSMIKKLKIYNDEKHQHHAQKPKKLEI